MGGKRRRNPVWQQVLLTQTYSMEEVTAVRMFTSKRARLLVGIIALMVAVTLVLPVTGCKKETVKGKTLGVAFSASPDPVDIVGYKMMDILRTKGINVKVVFCDGGPKAVQAMLAGQADIAANSLEDICNAGLMAFGLSRPKNVYAMVGRKDMTKVEDIKGGKLGAADPGSIANTIAEKIFEKHGVAKEDLTWMQIGGNKARAAALLAGNADAVFVYGGNYLRLRAEGYPTITTMQEEFPGMHDDMWCTTKEWLAKNEALAVEICKAQIEAARWFHESKAAWMALGKEKIEGFDEVIAGQLYDVLDEMNMYPEDGLMTAQTLQTTADFLTAAGVIPQQPISNWSSMKYMDQARKDLGITMP
jgi:ABC-type nitrate/sulfonate/bicarbonate transport system substrate-binding protein